MGRFKRRYKYLLSLLGATGLKSAAIIVAQHHKRELEARRGPKELNQDAEWFDFGYGRVGVEGGKTTDGKFGLRFSHALVPAEVGQHIGPGDTGPDRALMTFPTKGQRDAVYAAITKLAPDDNQCEIPSVGSRWRHKNGNVYTVIHITNTDNVRPDHPIDVVYQGENESVWSRRLTDWDRSFTLEHPLDEILDTEITK